MKNSKTLTIEPLHRIAVIALCVLATFAVAYDQYDNHQYKEQYKQSCNAKGC